MADYYTVVNRTDTVKNTVWDGKHYELAPHEEKVFPAEVAHAFKRWNIQMGSLDPRTGSYVNLVGFKDKDDCSTLVKEILIDPITGKPHIEVWDRAKLTGSRPTEVVPGDNGLYSTTSSSQALRNKSAQSSELGFDGQ